jgi:tRNA(His) guanylyltransferase
MSGKLKDRVESYQAASDYTLLPRLPLIMVINGRNFSKLTQLLDKPYCPKFSECILSTMLRLCTEVEGALFGYQCSDQIVLVARNDQNQDTAPWYNNNLQKICSITSAIATMHFNDCATSLNLNLTGDPLFTSQVFVVPTIGEAINTIIYKQQHNFHNSIQLACFYELIKKYDNNSIREMLAGLSVDEKIDLLNQECQTDFNQYPMPFRRGTVCYKVPKLVDGITKQKWFLNLEPPIFTKDASFLGNIFRMGSDIFRQESL